jgi:hypothetical protein
MNSQISTSFVHAYLTIASLAVNEPKLAQASRSLITPIMN